MKVFITTTTLLAGVATAFVIPDEPMRKQLSLLNEQTGTSNNPQAQDDNAIQTWWESIPKKDSILTSFEKTVSSGFKKTTSLVDDILNPSSPWPHWGGGGDHDGPHHPPPHHGDPTKTLYELIKSSKYTTKFAALIDEHEELKDILQTPASKQNHTIFVPTDKAFERIPDHHKEPPEWFIHGLLKYHVVQGLYPLHRVAYHHTLPSNLSITALGHHPERIRVHIPPLGHILPLKHLYLNFFNKIVAGDIIASNGIIHGLDGILVPPPTQEKIIQLLPSQFSTFRLAMEITGLGEDLDKREKEEKERNGGTLFAPTNRAFAKLGPRANAFLFSDYGKKYLRALLKYHIVANRTLYSDAFYEKPLEKKDQNGNGGGKEEDVEYGGGGHHGKKEFKRIDLPTLLDDKPVSVGITRWKTFIHIKVNDKVPVVVQDGIARDGVIQVVGNVLIPPHQHHDHDHDHDGDGDDDGDDKDEGSGDEEEEEEEEEEEDTVVDLDDLKARLESYMDSTPNKKSDEYYIGDL